MNFRVAPLRRNASALTFAYIAYVKCIKTSKINT